MVLPGRSGARNGIVDNSTDEPKGGDLRDLIAVLVRRSPLILIAVLVGAGAGYIVEKRQEPKYEATASLLFRSPRLDLQITGVPLQLPGNADRDALTDLKLVSLDVVRQRAAAELGPDYSAEDLEKSVDVAADGKSEIVEITASQPSGPQAALVANTLAKEFIVYREEALRKSLTSAVKAVREEYRQLGPVQRRRPGGESLRVGLEKLQLLRSVRPIEAEIAQPAAVPADPTSSEPAKTALIGGLLGLAIGLALALLVEHLDRRVRRTDQLEEAFGMPVIARVPRSRALSLKAIGKEGIFGRRRGGPEMEPFRRLWANLRYELGDSTLNSVLVTSSDAASGKTTVALRLAAAAASSCRVLLLEADLRRPQMSTVLDVERKPGLVAVLRERRAIDEEDVVRVVQTTGEPGADQATVSFDVLIAGEPTQAAGELLDSDTMRAVLEWAKAHYEFVVVDAPSPGLVSDSIPLMRQVDGVIVVGRLGRDSIGELRQLRVELGQLRVKPAGIVANFTRGGTTRAYSVGRS
jgi:succinoglycan biosynthesis transport protein ExoP